MRTRLPVRLRACGLALLAVLAVPPAAAWVSFGESDATAYYVDPDSIRVEGPQRRVWRLFDYKERQRNGVQSGKALIEIHCREGTYRYLRTMYYSGPMGKGKYLGGVREHRKEYIGPGTMISQLASFVCADRPPAKPGS